MFMIESNNRYPSSSVIVDLYAVVERRKEQPINYLTGLVRAKRESTTQSPASD